MQPARGDAGFSLIELLVATGLAAVLTAVFATTFATSAGLSGTSTLTLKVHEEHRRNLDAVANAFRGAAMSTFTGFDANNNATAPSFRCVTGMDNNGLILDAERHISWRATSEQVPDVASPGELIVTQNSVATVIARRVPAGGFRASLLGSMLRITLTTYSTGPNQRVAMLSGDTSLALRN